MSKGSSTYLLRLPASLKAAVAEISKDDGTSINQFIMTAVAEKTAAMKTAEFYNTRGAEADIEAARRLGCDATGASRRNLMMPWTSLIDGPSGVERDEDLLSWGAPDLPSGVREGQSTSWANGMQQAIALWLEVNATDL